MTLFQIGMLCVLFFFVGILFGELREALRWSKGLSTRIKFQGSYYWVVPDHEESCKRFLAHALSAPALWFDSPSYDSPKISEPLAISIASQILGSVPTHRFSNSVGWHLGDYWIIFYPLEAGEYFFQLQKDREPIATAVTRSLCLKDAAEWILQVMQNPHLQNKSYISYPDVEAYDLP